MNSKNISSRYLVLGLTAIAALLIVSAVLSYQNVRQLDEDARWVVHTHQVIDALDDVFNRLYQAEAVQRTFIITGGDKVPAAFGENIGAARQILDEVKRLTVDNADQQARIPDIFGRIDALEASWVRTSSKRQAEGFEAAQKIIQTGQHERTLAELEHLIEIMNKAERLLLRDRQEKTDRAYVIATVTGVVTAGLGLVAIALVFWLLQRFLGYQQRTTNAIYDQQQLLHATLSSVGDAVIATDTASRVTFLNEVAEKITGWSREQAVGLPLSNVFNIVNETTRQAVENPALRVLKEGVIVGLANHTILLAKDGAERPIDDSAAPIRDRHGAVIGSVLVFRDITEKKHAEAAQTERMRLVALRVDVGAALTAPHSTATALHLCCQAMVTHLDMAFARIWTLVNSDGVLELQASAGIYTHLDGPHRRVPVGKYKIGRIAGSRQAHLTNAVAQDPNISDPEWAKREGMVAFAGYPLMIEDRIVGVAAMFSRHTLSENILKDLPSVAESIAQYIDRKQGEERFRRQAELHRITLASIGDAVLTTDDEGRVTFLNDVAAKLTGWTLSEAAGQPIDAVLHIASELTGESVENPVGKVLREGTVVRLENHTVLHARGGAQRPIEDSAAPIKDEQGAVLGAVLVFHDVTQKRASEIALRSSEERLSLAVGAAGLGLWDWNVATGEIVWNIHHETIFGYAPGQSNRTYRDFADRILPEDRERIEVGFRKAMEERSDYRFEYRVVWPDGSIHWVESFGKFHYGAAGQPLRSVGVVFDITERRLAEEGLREADRRKNEFLATLAHELRNPLAPIRNGLQLMRIASNNKVAVEQARTMMERQLTQLVRLVDDLLDISRISRGKIELRRETVSLNTVIMSAVETSRPLIEQMRHQLTLTLPEAPILLNADLTRLAQVFLNLLNNSAKYTDPGGQIWLTALREGNEVTVSVSDTGIGIAADQLPHVFEMFSQADRSIDRAQGGLGIGLTLVKRLVEMHEGKVEARSEGTGKGSQFIVRLPAIAEDGELTPPALEESLSAGK